LSKQLVKDLGDGDFVSSHFQVESGQLHEFKNKSGKYAIFSLSDRTGEIRGVCWDKGEEIYHSIEIGSIARVEGRVVVFNRSLQITVDKINEELGDGFDPADFLGVSTQDTEGLFKFILSEIEANKNPWLKKVLKAFFQDEDFAAVFKDCPAAKTIHHNYIGGLVEHTANCVKLAKTVCDIYPQLRRDMLIAGTILHDIGKTVELSFNKKIDYTDEGRLSGHLVIGERMIWDKIRGIDGFPEKLRNELLHMIISHHGENATGSPKRPKMAEACALHFLENVDAQTKRFLQIIEAPQNASSHGAWTGYDRLLERYVYRGYDEDDKNE
jgi:3'-5' exoribonuclease